MRAAWLLVLAAACTCPPRPASPPSATAPAPATPDAGVDAAPPAASSCLAETGCPAPPPLEPCLSDDLPGDLLANVLADAPRLAGRQNGVVGTVRRGPARCTKMACPPERPCCNRCQATLALGDADPAHVLPLEGDGWSCAGDESLQCCGVAPEQQVVVTGTLEARGAGWALAGASACAI